MKEKKITKENRNMIYRKEKNKIHTMSLSKNVQQFGMISF